MDDELQTKAASLDYDPIERGLTLTVDNSPRPQHNISLIKAKLREQESKYTLEIIQLKKDYENHEENFRQEICKLNASHSDFLANHSLEIIQLKKDHEDRESQLQKEIFQLMSYQSEVESQIKTEKEAQDELQKLKILTEQELVVVTNKCSELQGRITESHAAKEASIKYFEQLVSQNDEQKRAMRAEFEEAAVGYQKEIQELNKKVQDYECQLEETHSTYKKSLADQNVLLSLKDEEMVEWNKNEQQRQEQDFQERNQLLNQIQALTDKHDAVYSERKDLASELEEFRESQAELFEKLRVDHDSGTAKLEERLASRMTQLEELKAQFEASQHSHELAVSELMSSCTKYEENIRFLKDTLRVIDNQNKELTNEIAEVRKQFTENSEIREKLSAKVDTLFAELDEARSKADELHDTNFCLEAKLSSAHKSLTDTTASKEKDVNLLVDELSELKTRMARDAQANESELKELVEQFNNLKESTTNDIAYKDKEVQKLSEKLNKLNSENETVAKENSDLQSSLEDQYANGRELDCRLASTQQQIAKQNLEMTRLVGQIVNMKEELIELKTRLDEAEQKSEFFKQRNEEISEKLAEERRNSANKIAEIESDVEEKRKVIEYLQNQASVSEKKKRRFFGPNKPEQPHE